MMGVVIMLVTVVVVRPKRDRNDGHMEIMGMFLAKRGRNRGEQSISGWPSLIVSLFGG